MLNQIVLVGRLVDKPEVKETETGKKVCNIILAVPRSFKNSGGEYDTDFIKCVLWENIAGNNTAEYCAKGDIIGIKGRVQTKDRMIGDVKITEQEIVAEKVTFLSSRSKDEEKENATDEV